MRRSVIEVLKFLYARLSQTEITWVLTGSTAFSIQSLPYIPSDIDIRTDRRGAYAFEELFAEFTRVPVHARRDSDVVRSYFGSFQISGETVEVMGDMQTRSDDGSWDPPPSLSELRIYFDFEGMKIPILPLTFESESYRKMRRLEKAQALATWAAATPTNALTP